MIKPYDLGQFQLADHAQKINIDQLVNQAKKDLKISLVQSQIRALGIEIHLTTSKTRFNGKRLWFLCPTCNRRIGTLYKHPLQEKIGCRICLQLYYRKQRFNRMMETKLCPLIEFLSSRNIERDLPYQL